MKTKRIVLMTLCVMLFAVAAFAQAEKSVSRIYFTTNVVDREPVDDISTFTASNGGSVFFFAELMNMQDSSVTVAWTKNGEQIHSQVVNVGGPRWRVPISMRAEHFKAGDNVTVTITGTDGAQYATKQLTII